MVVNSILSLTWSLLHVFVSNLDILFQSMSNPRNSIIRPLNQDAAGTVNMIVLQLGRGTGAQLGAIMNTTSFATSQVGKISDFPENLRKGWRSPFDTDGLGMFRMGFFLWEIYIYMQLILVFVYVYEGFFCIADLYVSHV